MLALRARVARKLRIFKQDELRISMNLAKTLIMKRREAKIRNASFNELFKMLDTCSRIAKKVFSSIGLLRRLDLVGTLRIRYPSVSPLVVKFLW